MQKHHVKTAIDEIILQSIEHNLTNSQSRQLQNL